MLSDKIQPMIAHPVHRLSRGPSQSRWLATAVMIAVGATTMITVQVGEITNAVTAAITTDLTGATGRRDAVAVSGLRTGIEI